MSLLPWCIPQSSGPLGLGRVGPGKGPSHLHMVEEHLQGSLDAAQLWLWTWTVALRTFLHLVSYMELQHVIVPFLKQTFLASSGIFHVG